MTSPTALPAAHLTVFRFVAALIVVIFHYGRVATGQNGFLAAGPQMVTFFFVLSGFVMVLAYGGAGTVPARGYWRARAVRILPAYYLALLAAVFIARWQHRQVGWPPFGLSLGLLQAWLPDYATRINPPGWSLSVEALFYLLFPALLLYSNRRKPGDWIGPALGFWLLSQSLLLLVLLTGEDPQPGGWAGNLVLYNPLAHLCSFVLGMAAGLKYRTLGADALGRPGQALLILVSLIMVCCVGSESLFHGHDRTMPIYAASFWAPLFALWILLMAQVPARLARVLSAPAAVHLGEISFGFYIYQAPLYRLWQVVSPLGPTTSLASFLAYLLTLLLVAHGSHVWVEQPLRRWLLRPPPVRGLVAGPASSEVLSAGVAKPDQGACR